MPSAPDHASSLAPRSGFTSTDALLVLMALIWGANVPVVKYAMRTLSPLAFTGARVLIAMVCLFGAAAATRAPRPVRRDVFALLALGILGHGVYQVLFVEGVARTRAGNAALLLAAAPVFIAALTWMRGDEHLTSRRITGITLSTIGIALVVLGTRSIGIQGSTVAGDMLILAAAISWSGFTVLLKPYTDRVHPLHVSGLTLAGGFGPLMIVGAGAMRATPWRTLPATIWAALAFSSVAALVIAYMFWYRGMRVLGPTRTSLYGNLQPVFGLLFAWILLGELPTSVQGLGAGSIIGGLWLARS